MAILKFRIYWEEDDSVYRDVEIKHSQTFMDLHLSILKCFEFDNKHRATFFRSNDHWKRGREISLETYPEITYQVEPLLMEDTVIGNEIRNPNQKFIYLYDFHKNWVFLVELIGVSKHETIMREYPFCLRSEGIAPPQYGNKGLVNDKLAEIEEKYDITATEMQEGYSSEGEEGDSAAEESFSDEDEDTEA